MKRSELPYPSFTAVKCPLCDRDITKNDTEAHLWGMHMDVDKVDEIRTMRGSHRYMMNFICIMKNTYPGVFDHITEELQRLNES